MSRRQSRGYSPVFLVFLLTGATFIFMVAYCVAGGWGAAGAVAFVALISLIVRSDIAASDQRQRQADNQFVHYYAANTPAPQRGSRTRRRNRDW